MANLLFIKCVSLWQILSHDFLRIRQHAYNEDWHTGCPAEHADQQHIPLAEWKAESVPGHTSSEAQGLTQPLWNPFITILSSTHHTDKGYRYHRYHPSHTATAGDSTMAPSLHNQRPPIWLRCFKRLLQGTVPYISGHYQRRSKGARSSLQTATRLREADTPSEVGAVAVTHTYGKGWIW